LTRRSPELRPKAGIINYQNMSLSASILARLQCQHQTIHELISGLPEVRVRQRAQPDKWSAFENIAHLAAYQPVFLRRLERMRKETSPEFERYVAEKDPLFPAYLERSLPALLAEIGEKRSFIYSELTGMDEETLGRTGLHPRYGLFTIGQWAEFFLLHEAHHLYTVFLQVQEQRKAFAQAGDQLHKRAADL